MKKGTEVDRLEEVVRATAYPPGLDGLDRQAEQNRASREVWDLVTLLADTEQELQELRERMTRAIREAGEGVPSLDRIAGRARFALSQSWQVRKLARIGDDYRHGK